MRQKPFNCIFFDWDLTLVRVLGDVSPEERLTALFQNEGLPFTLREVQNAVRLYQDDVRTGKIERPSTQQTQQDIVRYYHDILVRLTDASLDKDQVDHLYNAFARLPLVPYEDTRPVLQELQARAVKVGLVTNHSRLIRPLIEQILGEFIPPELIIISQELGIHKPDGAIYRQAAAQAQEPPAACIFAGNDLQADAIGAVEAGGFGLGLWLDRLNQAENAPDLPPNVIRISSLWHVLDYL